MSKLFVDEIVHQSSQGSGTITIGASGEKVDLGTGVSGGTLTNTPSFFVRKIGNQSMAADTDVKLIPDDEIYDTDSAYDTSTGRFTVPTGKGGKYFLSYGFGMQNLDDNKQVAVNIKVNGSFLEPSGTTVLSGSYSFMNAAATSGANSDDPGVATSVMLVLSAGDYVEMWGRHRNSAAENGRFMHFGGFRLIGV